MACIIIVTEIYSILWSQKRFFIFQFQPAQAAKTSTCSNYGSPEMSTHCKSGKMKQITSTVKMITIHMVIQKVSVTKSVST